MRSSACFVTLPLLSSKGSIEEMIASFPQSGQGRFGKRSTDRSPTLGLVLKRKVIYALPLSNLSPAYVFELFSINIRVGDFKKY